MAALVFNRTKKELWSATINWGTASIKVMLVTAAYTPLPAHNFISQGAAAAELSGTGYVSGFGGSGRKLLVSKTTTQDDSGNRGVFDAADLTWSAINAGVAAAAILILEGTSDSDSRILAYTDTGGFPKTTNGGDFTIQWSASGIAQVS